MIRSSFLESLENNTVCLKNENEVDLESEAECSKEVQRNKSISTWLIFLETLKESGAMQTVSRNFIFTLVALHHLHPGISKIMKKCEVRYLSSDPVRTGGAQGERKSFA